MDAQAWITLATVVVMAVALVRDMARPDHIFLGGLGVLLVFRVITPGEAFAGFANPAVISIGALFVVAAGIERSGVLLAVDRYIFSADPKLSRALPRFLFPVAVLSAFINNTPIVAMLTQPAKKWAERRGIAPSKVLIPLSYAAIAGGMATLVGTSTNVIVSGLMVEYGYAPFGLFDLAWTGVPTLIVVILFMATWGNRLLPDRGAVEPGERRRKVGWTFEVQIGRRALRGGDTVYKTGLARQGNAELVHVRRGDFVLTPTPDTVLKPGDVLMFSGDVGVLEDLLARPGVRPRLAVEEGKELRLYEAVVSDTSFLVGRTLEEVAFRDRYGAVVLAIQRKTARIDEPLRGVSIKAGDLFLVGAAQGFTGRWLSRTEEFYYVAPRGTPGRQFSPRKAFTAFGILVGMLGTVGFNLLPLSIAAFAAAVAMVASGCIRMDHGRRALDLQVLLLIAAALGLGQAVVKTGLTDGVADVLLGLSGAGLLLVLVALYLTTNLLTELITHKAAAVLMLPIALSMADQLGVNPIAMALTVTVAAAASFVTPVGYQTNLMVMSAGQYRYADYIRVGLPVSLLVMSTAILMIFLKWM